MVLSRCVISLIISLNYSWLKEDMYEFIPLDMHRGVFKLFSNYEFDIKIHISLVLVILRLTRLISRCFQYLVLKNECKIDPKITTSLWWENGEHSRSEIMDYVTDTSPFLPQNKKRKKCVHKNNYIISDMKCILPSWIAFDRLRYSSHSISQHFQKLFSLKESCGVMYFIFVALYCLLPFGKYDFTRIDKFNVLRFGYLLHYNGKYLSS